MKYTLKDKGDSLDIHFNIYLLLTDRYEKDVSISLEKEDLELIKEWYIEETLYLRDIYNIKNFNINNIEKNKFSISFTLPIKQNITLPFLRSLIEEISSPDIHRIHFLEVQQFVVFPTAYIEDSF